MARWAWAGFPFMSASPLLALQWEAKFSGGGVVCLLASLPGRSGVPHFRLRFRLDGWLKPLLRVCM